MHCPVCLENMKITHQQVVVLVSSNILLAMKVLLRWKKTNCISNCSKLSGILFRNVV